MAPKSKSSKKGKGRATGPKKLVVAYKKPPPPASGSETDEVEVLAEESAASAGAPSDLEESPTKRAKPTPAKAGPGPGKSTPGKSTPAKAAKKRVKPPGGKILYKEEEEELVLWIKERPMLYDMEDPRFVDTAGKAKLWVDRAEEMGVEPSELHKWYKSTRTAYGRIMDGKSGDPASSPSPRIRWMHQHLEFMRKHIRRRAAEKQRGPTLKSRLGLEEESDESDEEPPQSTSTSKAKSGTKSAKRANLLQLVDDVKASRVESIDAIRKMQETLQQEPPEPQGVSSERIHFAKWVSDLIYRIPEDYWLEVRHEVMNYLSRCELSFKRAGVLPAPPPSLLVTQASTATSQSQVLPTLTGLKRPTATTLRRPPGAVFQQSNTNLLNYQLQPISSQQPLYTVTSLPQTVQTTQSGKPHTTFQGVLNPRPESAPAQVWGNIMDMNMHTPQMQTHTATQGTMGDIIGFQSALAGASNLTADSQASLDLSRLIQESEKDGQ